MKLNGWPRLAIVLGGAWAVCVGSLAVYEALARHDGFFVGLTLPVGTVVTGNKVKLPDGRTVELNVRLEGRSIKPWEIKWDNEPEIPTERIVRWEKLLAAIAIPLAVWLIIEVLVRVGTWVTRGFRE